MRALYLILLTLVAPFVLLALQRPWRRGAEAGRWRERLGGGATLDGGLEVWVHAASFGEVQAATPLIDALLVRHGDGRIGVTTMTATGSQLVRQRWGARVVHAYVPLDLPPCVRARLLRWRPRRVVVMESELWPTLYRELARRGIPLLLANARMSPRSRRRYRQLGPVIGPLVRDTVAAASAVAAQSAHDADSYRTLGARRVEITGNLKFDCVVPDAQRRAGAALRAALGDRRPVWIAASTHDGEEAAALDAHRDVLRDVPGAVLILVPRHPQRFAAVWQLVRASGMAAARRSAGDAGPDTHVLLGDSMGEMFCYLAAADLALVGGSLVPVGGHNVLEPAALGRPVLFGPEMHNQLPARALLLEAGAAREVADTPQLAQAVVTLLRDPRCAREMGERARASLGGHQGATGRVVALLEAIAPSAAG